MTNPGLTIDQEYNDGDGVRGYIYKLNENVLIEISEISPHHSFYDKEFDDIFTSNKMGIQIKTDSMDEWVEYLTGKYKIIGPMPRPWGSRYLLFKRSRQFTNNYLRREKVGRSGENSKKGYSSLPELF